MRRLLLPLILATVLPPALSLALVSLSGCGSSEDPGAIGYWQTGQNPEGSGTPAAHPSASATSTSTAAPSTTSTSTAPAPSSTSTVPATGDPPPASGDDAGSTTTSSSFTVTLDSTTQSLNLASSTTVKVSVAPTGFSGSVTLSVANLPSGVTAKFDNATLSLDGSAATATLTLTSTTDVAPGPVPFNIVAEGGGATTMTASTLTVVSELTITIPSGVDQNGGTTADPVTNAFGPYPITITAPANISSANPVVIHFFNGDTVPHEIHASSPAAGFPHGSGEFGPGTMETPTRNVNEKGTYDFYLHDQGAAKTVGRIVIQ